MLMRKTHPLLKLINTMLMDLPSPTNISYLWNFGSLMGICLMMQIISGLMLTFHYCSDISLAFNSIDHITRDVNNGWILRFIHANGASMFFMLIYLHIGRGMYYSSFFLLETWLTGTLILLLLMATAFLGYVLPWGQMSFWGATVITNLLSAIPYFGPQITLWIWGGFSIDNATLTRFFSLHFILPFILMMMVIIHLMFLHETGSNNPMGLTTNIDKIPFHPYFTWKDILGFMTMSMLFMFIIMINPYILNDPENFIPANPMSTPPHIQPEWYFLFAYAILRSIPNKLGGVIALLTSILIIMTLPLSMKPTFSSMHFYSISKYMFWMLINIVILLTYMGACPVEPPYIFMSQMLTILYFLFYLLLPIIS